MSVKQREANRRNALQSIGPRTAEGVEECKLNAFRHGLRAVQPVVPEEPADPGSRPCWAAGGHGHDPYAQSDRDWVPTARSPASAPRNEHDSGTASPPTVAPGS